VCTAPPQYGLRQLDLCRAGSSTRWAQPQPAALGASLPRTLPAPILLLPPEWLPLRLLAVAAAAAAAAAALARPTLPLLVLILAPLAAVSR